MQARWLLLSILCLLSAPATSRADDMAFDLHFRDHGFMPSLLTVPAGVKFRLTVTNDEASAAEFESTDVHREKLVLPGRQVTLFIGPLDPGRYEFFDDFLPDRRGWIQVTAPPNNTSGKKATP